MNEKDVKNKLSDFANKSDRDGSKNPEKNSSLRDVDINKDGRIPKMPPSLKDILGKRSPEKKFKIGSIYATIWLNEGHDKDGKVTHYKTVTFDRRYLDKEGNWQSTNTLRMSDLPKAVLVLNKAYEYLAFDETEQDDD